MSEPLARLYDLALRTLDDQERRADALRARLGPVLAAAALGVTLLSGPVVGGEPPTTRAGSVALAIGVGGLFIAVVAALSMLRVGRRRSSNIEAATLVERLSADGAIADPSAFYPTMIALIGRETEDNAALLVRLHARFTAMLCGILVLLCGLAIAALVG
ncbi:MAG TPA: hypothetical protein VKB03_02650 [Conexibacter sp.]|nr:hypothetical protein [Conexibacter sp.]